MSRCASALLLAVLGVTRSAYAETVELIGGGRISGEILSAPSGSDETLTIRTIAGGTVAVPRGQVVRIIPASSAEQEYRRLRDQTAETPEGHLSLARWCKAHALPEHHKAHLHKVLQLQPDHLEARQLLGYVKREGRWVTQEELMLSRGYVLHRGRWRLPQEVRILERRKDQKQARSEWFRRIKLWHGWLTSRNADRQREGLQLLRQVADPDALEALETHLGGDPDHQVRLLYVDVLAEIPGSAALEALVVRSLGDESADVRWTATEHLAKHKSKQAVVLYTRALRHLDNLLVRRAATALGAFEDPQAVGPLIEALVTAHLVEAGSGGGLGMAFTSEREGTFDIAPSTLRKAITKTPVAPAFGGTALSLGQSQKVVSVDIRNNEALFSLTKLTGQNFGFNEAAWTNWWASYLESRDQKLSQTPSD